MDISTRKYAQKAGLKFYFTGKACGQGHIAERYTSTCQCKDCQSNHSKTDKACQRRKQHRLDHIEAYRARGVQWNADNKEHRAQYRKDNKEHISAYDEQYRINNRGKRTAIQNQRHTRKLNATPVWSETKLIEKLYIESARLTANGVKHNVDHIVPLQGKTVCGLHVIGNLQIIDETTNLIKHNKFE